MQARYYDPALGRFIGEDPDYSGVNWYIYAADDPINFVDFTGKDIGSFVSEVIYQVLQKLINDPTSFNRTLQLLFNLINNYMKGGAINAAKDDAIEQDGQRKDITGNEFGGKAEEIAGGVGIMNDVQNVVGGIEAQQEVEEAIIGLDSWADDGGLQVMNSD